ncbi:hypothetical protein WJX72_009475 [[Myrmecia] bisecta]|uniref:Uncharacterized protein n=1 Tax=[Myrmecia] bisecta TaxID=41462 RepID=A0AAW1PHV0_9CHLO
MYLYFNPVTGCNVKVQDLCTSPLCQGSACLPGTEICNYDVKSSSGDEGPFVVHDDAYDDSSQSDYWDDPDDFDEMFAMLGHGMMHA